MSVSRDVKASSHRAVCLSELNLFAFTFAKSRNSTSQQAQ